MTSSELLSTLEIALGGLCPAPRASSRLLELAVTPELFERLLRHWAVLPAVSRPNLRGLTISREVPANTELLLELGPRLPLLLVTVGSGWAARSLTGIWPYCRWWEEELCGFERIPLAGRTESAGVTWRHG